VTVGPELRPLRMPSLTMPSLAGPDDVPTEGTGYLQGRTFPHPFKLGTSKVIEEKVGNYYDAVTNSPMGNELLLEFAKSAIIAESSGNRCRRSAVR